MVRYSLLGISSNLLSEDKDQSQYSKAIMNLPDQAISHDYFLHDEDVIQLPQAWDKFIHITLDPYNTGDHLFRLRGVLPLLVFAPLFPLGCTHSFGRPLGKLALDFADVKPSLRCTIILLVSAAVLWGSIRYCIGDSFCILHVYSRILKDFNTKFTLPMQERTPTSHLTAPLICSEDIE